MCDEWFNLSPLRLCEDKISPYYSMRCCSWQWFPDVYCLQTVLEYFRWCGQIGTDFLECSLMCVLRPWLLSEHVESWCSTWLAWCWRFADHEKIWMIESLHQSLLEWRLLGGLLSGHEYNSQDHWKYLSPEISQLYNVILGQIAMSSGHGRWAASPICRHLPM